MSKEITSVKVEQVKNGFIVDLKIDYGRSGAQTIVYQTMNELILFIKDHFSHRETTVHLDNEAEE